MTDKNLAQLRQVYDWYRTALLNRKYYGHQLDARKRWNRALEIGLAVFTPGVVGGWHLWQHGSWPVVWTVIGAATAVVAAIKPFLDWPEDIERFSRLHAEHAVLFYTLKQVVEDIEIAQTITDDALRRFDGVRKQYAQLSRDDDPKPRRELQRACYREVCSEIPADRLWLPEEEEPS